MARNGLALFKELEVWDVTAVTKAYALGGQRVALRRDGILSYVHTDHLGSASVLTDASGQVVPNTRLRYYPFGAPRPEGTTGTHNAFATGYSDATFTGQRRDVGTGLYFYGARYYDSAIGRFLAPDTIVPQPGNPQALNRYSYVGNRPLGFVDPTGHAQVCGTDVGGGCGGPDALHLIEMYLMQGKMDKLGARLAYKQYFLAHPDESPDNYQPLTRNPDDAMFLTGTLMSTGYMDAQAELGSPNLMGIVAGTATSNGVSEAVSAGATFGIGLLAVGLVGAQRTPATSETMLKRAFRSEQDRFLRKGETGLSVHIGATDEQISAHLRGDILTVSHSEVQDLGMAVTKTPGAIQALEPYHYEIVQGAAQTWNQFKNALKSLLWR